MTPCPICATPSEPSMAATDENRRISGDTFIYATCPACRTVFLTNPPADLGRYYEDEYYEVPTLERLDVQADKERNKIDIVRRFASGNRVLEIGPGFGVFAYQAKRAGFAVDVIEMDERCCDYLRRQVGVGVTQSDQPHTAIRTLGPHDVIALWHVIEHLPAIPELIAATADNLAPGGVLVIATPNPEATQFRVMGKHWPHLDAPRHLALLPRETLTQLCARHGLAPEFATTDDYHGRHWNFFGWQWLLMNRVRGRSLKRAMLAAGSVLGLLMSPFDRRPGRGSAYTIVLRKAA